MLVSSISLLTENVFTVVDSSLNSSRQSLNVNPVNSVNPLILILASEVDTVTMAGSMVNSRSGQRFGEMSGVSDGDGVSKMVFLEASSRIGHVTRCIIKALLLR